MSKAEILAELFEHYADDAEGALAAMANVAPDVWSHYTDIAAMRMYLADYKSWVRQQTRQVAKVGPKAARLFEVDDAERVTLRTRIALLFDGRRCEFDVLSLAGAEGAAILRAAADRDERPARTTLIRATFYRKLADEVQRRSETERRDVSVAEIVAEAEAAAA